MPTMPTQVLVIEDDDDNRTAVRMILEDAGYPVLEAADADRALDTLRTSPQGLVAVFDYRMPRMDGAALLALAERAGWLAERHAFVCLTASPQQLPPTLSALLARYEVPLVGKPFDLDELLAAVKQAERRLTRRTRRGDRLRRAAGRRAGRGPGGSAEPAEPAEPAELAETEQGAQTTDAAEGAPFGVGTARFRHLVDAARARWTALRGWQQGRRA